MPVVGGCDAALSLGAGVGVEVAGCGLLVGDGLLVADGLLAGAGEADGEVVAELTADGGTVGAETGVGTVDRVAELGKRVMRAGSAGAGLWLVAGGADVAAEAGETDTGIGAPRLAGPAAALFAVAVGQPAELAAPTR